MAVEFVAVHALEDDALAVEQHQAVLHLKAAQARIRLTDLDRLAAARERHAHAVEVRLLGAPQARMGDRDLQVHLRRTVRLEGIAPLDLDPDARALGAVDLHAQAQRGAGKVVGQLARHEQVSQVRRRLAQQPHVPEQAREAPKVLILQVAGRAALVHLDAHAVDALVQAVRHVKRRRREGCPRCIPGTCHSPRRTARSPRRQSAARCGRPSATTRAR